MTTNRTVPERIGDWSQVYEAVRADLTPQGIRVLTSMMTPEQLKDADGNDVPLNPIAIKLGIEAAKIAFQNDRTAAIVAAMLTQSGVSRQTFNTDTAETS